MELVTTIYYLIFECLYIILWYNKYNLSPTTFHHFFWPSLLGLFAIDVCVVNTLNEGDIWYSTMINRDEKSISS